MRALSALCSPHSSGECFACAHVQYTMASGWLRLQHGVLVQSILAFQ